ncbi:AEC family transporter [Limoniibacter endophyticus]|uniref:Malonate transporter n=1 Tax=Limoniibacter endophyticus TaxID=1565040 RepID=A0A8J3GGI2_9HYPH|nr:AEC family transporter [Limoniibacter endophyticus]GHC60245.1 malonate transporter [Limoniibacter endophyticus]
MLEIAALMLPFFGLIAIGYIAARITRQPVEALGWLNTFIIYIALPALFFDLIISTPLDQLVRFDFIGLSLLATYCIFTLIFLTGLFLRKASLREAAIQAYGGSYGNIGYMGPGIAIVALGEQAVAPVALIVCLENAAHFITAPALMAVQGDRRSGLAIVASVVRNVLTHPFIVAMIAGFVAALLEIRPYVPIQQLIDYLAQCAAPCALFAMGVTLALRPIKRVPAEIGYLVPAKLLLHPLLAYVILTSLGTFEPIWISAAVLLAALPTATNVFVLAQQYGVWQERASATVVVTTATSLLTLPAILFWMR